MDPTDDIGWSTGHGSNAPVYLDAFSQAGGFTCLALCFSVRSPHQAPQQRTIARHALSRLKAAAIT